MTPLTHVLLGAVIMGDVIAALFFVRFWKMTGDRFFLFFAASFITVAVSRVVVDENIPPFGYEPFGYMIRILSYLFIIAGILYKNTGVRASRTVTPPGRATVPQESLP
jgi:Family of unknown function (DUF5985)